MKFSELTRVNAANNGPHHPTRMEEIGLLEFSGDLEADLSAPRYDSRDVVLGDVFFAIRGYATDGHSFIRQAIERGAKTIVLEDAAALTREDAEAAGVNRMLVKNSRLALALMSEAASGYPSTRLRMIGVTGTNGKTTVTHVIKQLLEAHGERIGLIGTVGIKIGDKEIEATHTTPESRDLSEILAKMVDEGVTTCVMEVSSHALVLDRVAALDFDIAVFTNLTQDHLDFHQTMEAYFEAKQRLFNSLKDTAIAITNADDPRGFDMVANTVANSHSYGIRHACDLQARDVQISIDGNAFSVQKRYSDERADVRTALVGGFNIENTLAAMSALYFGVEGYPLATLAELMSGMKPVRGRFETIRLKNGATAIVDYAHTPDALENVLKTIKAVIQGGFVITVFGCGGNRDRLKRPEMGRVAAGLSDSVFLTSDNPRSEQPDSIIEEIWAGIPEVLRSKVRIEPDRAQAIELALSSAAPGDVVLIAGKGHETYQLIGTERRHFDDREEVLKFDKNQ